MFSKYFKTCCIFISLKSNLRTKIYEDQQDQQSNQISSALDLQNIEMVSSKSLLRRLTNRL